MKNVFLVLIVMLFVALSLPCFVNADSTGVKEGVAETTRDVKKGVQDVGSGIKQGGKEVGNCFQGGVSGSGKKC